MKSQLARIAYVINWKWNMRWILMSASKIIEASKLAGFYTCTHRLPIFPQRLEAVCFLMYICTMYNLDFINIYRRGDRKVGRQTSRVWRSRCTLSHIPDYKIPNNFIARSNSMMIHNVSFWSACLPFAQKKSVSGVRSFSFIVSGCTSVSVRRRICSRSYSSFEKLNCKIDGSRIRDKIRK